ncbi:LUD domain-containing protein [Candidatus Uhrbacteria bacterium]|nr:LUD domain-containing protein [Candidatus Uhrbacteria bacterium]
MAFDILASDEAIVKTVAALAANGIATIVVENGEAAKRKVLELVPEGAEVMTMSSVTLDIIGLLKELNESGKFAPIRAKFKAMDRKTQGSLMQKMGAGPDWAIGSVHAVTEDGHVLIASATGSQLPAYAYGSSHVVWVVGAQKIVRDSDEGMRRIYEHCLPLEDARARKVYGIGSGVNKVLTINKEVQAGRITMVIVKEKLGF